MRHLNTQKYKNAFSLAKNNRFLYKKNHSNFDGQNSGFYCVRNFWQKAIVYMFSLIYICLDFH